MSVANTLYQYRASHMDRLCQLPIHVCIPSPPGSSISSFSTALHAAYLSTAIRVACLSTALRIAYLSTALRACYAMPSTDIRCAATRCLCDIQY
eukprot:3409581-Rhodomonas_salina.1